MTSEKCFKRYFYSQSFAMLNPLFSTVSAVYGRIGLQSRPEGPSCIPLYLQPFLLHRCLQGCGIPVWSSTGLYLNGAPDSIIENIEIWTMRVARLTMTKSQTGPPRTSFACERSLGMMHCPAPRVLLLVRVDVRPALHCPASGVHQP